MSRNAIITGDPKKRLSVNHHNRDNHNSNITPRNKRRLERKPKPKPKDRNP